MNCPLCQSALERKRYRDIDIDACPACSGIWFDQGELGEFLHRYVEDHQDLPNSTIQLDLAVTTVEHLREPIRSCPHCNQPLDKVNYAYNSNIIVDNCLACGGVWVDGSEVKQLAVHVKGNPKLDKLATSLAEYVSEREHTRDMIEAAHELGRNVGIWMFLPKIIVPVGDDASRRTVPGITLGIILVNAIVLAWMYYSPMELPVLFSAYGFIPQRVMAGEALFTFISAMFLHAGVFHLIANSFFLWIFGDNVEDVFGHVLFIAFYLACGVCASLAFLLLHMDSAVPALGASGAVSGVMGAYFVLHPHARVRTFVIFTVIKIPAYVYLGLWFVGQLLFASLYGALEPVGFSAHAGGFAAGITLAMLHKALAGRKRR